MGVVKTFSVSKRGAEAIECSRELPENLDDKLWDEIVSEKADISDLALQAWLVKCQAGARSRMEHGEKAVRDYAAAYVYGARSGGGVARPVIGADEAKSQKFTASQLEFLRNAGVAVPS